MRDGIYIPLNTITKAWRVGKVLMKGNKSTNVEVGKQVIFPHGQGIQVKNLKVILDGEEVITGKSVFLNENRLFGQAIASK